MEEQILGLPEEDKFDWKEIFELFHKPNIKDFDFNFGKINEYLDIKKFLIITDLGEATFCIDKTANLL